MKAVWLVLLAIAIGCTCSVLAEAQLNCSGGPLNCTPGQIPGTATNDSAAAGFVGEYITANLGTGSAVSLASGSASPIISIILTAGDWDVEGIAVYTAASTTSVTSLTQGSTSAANCLTSPVIPPQFQYSALEIAANILAPVVDPELPVPTTRYSVAVSTTVCLIVKPTFTASTLKGYGLILARRRR